MGGRSELRRLVEANDMRGWAHHILHSAADGDVEFAVGETRYDDGRRISTRGHGRARRARAAWRRYMVARSPAIVFDADEPADA